MLCLQTIGRRFRLKRFHFNDDEENEEENHDQEHIGPEFFSMAQFPLESGNRILEAAIKICENSFFWKFYKLQTKLNKIKESYDFLRNLEELEGDQI